MRAPNRPLELEMPPRTNVRHGIQKSRNNKHSESTEICFRVRSYEQQRDIVRKMLEGVQEVTLMSSALDRLFTSRRRFGTFGFASLILGVHFGKLTAGAAFDSHVQSENISGAYLLGA
jgi:hypothetical protein